jgi:hypothetical protein
MSEGDGWNEVEGRRGGGLREEKYGVRTAARKHRKLFIKATNLRFFHEPRRLASFYNPSAYEKTNISISAELLI